MRKAIKKIFRTLIGSIIVFIFVFIISLLFEIIKIFCPTLYIIIGILVFLCVGYIVGNEILIKNEDVEE